MKNKGLGKGLRALIPTELEGLEDGVEIVELPWIRLNRVPSRRGKNLIRKH